jgi:hypothetical protein
MIYWKIISLIFKKQSITHFKTKVNNFVKISENEVVKKNEFSKILSIYF